LRNKWDNMADQESNAPKEKTPRGWQAFWTDQFSAADKRLATFTRQGNRVNDAYLGETPNNRDSLDLEGDSSGMFELNLFHTNIKTTQDMMMGQTPKIDVSREHQDPNDDVARVASMILERMLDASVDPSGDDLSATLKSVLFDRLVPGLGVARVRYDFTTKKEMVLNPQTMEPEEIERITDEEAPCDYVHWQDFKWGWARSWRELPWIAFRSWLTKEEATVRFSEAKAESMEYRDQTPSGDEDSNAMEDPDQYSNIQKAEVWEIWNKQDKKLYFWSKGTNTILETADDPLELRGFWPTPMPMMANLSTSKLAPKADYVLAQDLYVEIDILSTRIAHITRAVKVVGVYAADQSASVGRMLKEGNDNDLIPVDNWAMFAEKGGLQGTIEWFPVETVVNTLSVLQGIRDQTMTLLYEVTGMSDLMRGGNTDQYTSDGTNQLKAKFGSVGVQALQDEFARFASDLENLKAQVIAKHFQPDSILVQSNAQYLPPPDQQLIEPALQLIKTPDLKWRVNIKPESLSMVDYAQLKSERTEFLNAMGSYLQAATVAAKEVPGATPMLLEMMKWTMSSFKGADAMEGMMDQVIDQANQAAQQAAQQPPQPDPAEAAKAADNKAKMELQQMKGQQDLQKIQAKSQADIMTANAKIQGEVEKITVDATRDQALLNIGTENELRKIRAELEATMQEIDAKLVADAETERVQSQMAIAEDQVEHANSLTESAVEHEYTMDEIRAQGEQVRSEEDDD
jgi:hypothetical protein